MENRAFLKQKFLENGFELTETQTNQFLEYYQLLIDWNKDMNLTSLTDFEDVVIKHFVDSCLGEKFIPKNSVVMDIGVGAGFPSIPLAIIRPDLSFVLVDSLAKRITFLSAVVGTLRLTGISLIHSRAEDLAKKDVYRENMDVVVARAVAKLPTLLEYCLPFVKIDGLFVGYKSNVEEEIEESSTALKLLSGQLEKVEEKDLYGQKRTFVIVKKIGNTLIKYPRGQNKPRTQPLGASKYSNKTP